jgi:hypothetical protein
VRCGGLRPELRLEGHHSSPGRETEGESACAYMLCCARARCGVGLAAAAPPRARDHEGDLSHPGNRGFFLWLKALGGVGAYQCTEFFSKVLRLCLESELEPKRGCLSWLQEIL